MVQALGYATESARGELKPYEFKRKDPAENEVQISVKYCGVCHSDVYQTRNKCSNTNYPCMPEHEIIGVVEKKAAKVKNLKVLTPDVLLNASIFIMKVSRSFFTASEITLC